MPTLLSNGSAIFIHPAPPCLPCTSGGVGNTIFSSGRRGGTNRAGRWNARRLMPLLLHLRDQPVHLTLTCVTANLAGGVAATPRSTSSTAIPSWLTGNVPAAAQEPGFAVSSSTKPARRVPLSPDRT